MRSAVRAVAETDGDKYSGHRLCGALFLFDQLSKLLLWRHFLECKLNT